MTQSPGSDEFAKDTPENDVHRLLITGDETNEVFQQSPVILPNASIRNGMASSFFSF